MFSLNLPSYSLDSSSPPSSWSTKSKEPRPQQYTKGWSVDGGRATRTTHGFRRSNRIWYSSESRKKPASERGLYLFCILGASWLGVGLSIEVL
ncbi:hypothetical protein CIPAW_06G066000 [Carya illinoinensis]|uniref:Uncharacterized protein n=1 Tax=Carya illinoinensis TaxID=32201 RepID=A0A8T1Q8M3_CARIL|nr:hypothetical protein CIPAW_06G066000 [Carya illinoinensis]